MLGRFGIILGAYLTAPMMGVYTGLVVALGHSWSTPRFLGRETECVEEIGVDNI